MLIIDMRSISTHILVLSVVFSAVLSACGEEDKPMDTATVDTNDTESPEDTSDTDTSVSDTDTADTEDPLDTADTLDTDTGDSDDTGAVDTADTGTSMEPGLNAVPDFSLADINPNSITMGQDISPRDYLQQISGWYFIKST
jgi:hypothetical protein